MQNFGADSTAVSDKLSSTGTTIRTQAVTSARALPVSADGCCFVDCGPLANKQSGYERPCAYNQATCCRYHRLGALLSAMEPRVKRRLRWLNDHKGILTACWRFEPPSADKVHIAQLWETVGKEFSDAVQHTNGIA